MSMKCWLLWLMLFSVLIFRWLKSPLITTPDAFKFDLLAKMWKFTSLSEILDKLQCAQSRMTTVSSSFLLQPCALPVDKSDVYQFDISSQMVTISMIILGIMSVKVVQYCYNKLGLFCWFWLLLPSLISLYTSISLVPSSISLSISHMSLRISIL